jgi:L-asparaginase/Glu-tRNA(Gln) amidotransferase subunit D
MVIHITGGTIDSSYSESADTARPYEHSRIAEYFAETLGVKLPEPELTFNEITMKDSRELTETEIRELMDQIKNNSHKNQIATAGTYALPDLASSSDKMMQSGEMQNSTVTYVGAMLPDDVIFNDGYFNLGFALGKTPHVDPGVYVAMHGWMTHPDNVMKQLQKAEFVPYDLDNRV